MNTFKPDFQKYSRNLRSVYVALITATIVGTLSAVKMVLIGLSALLLMYADTVPAFADLRDFLAQYDMSIKNLLGVAVLSATFTLALFVAAQSCVRATFIKIWSYATDLKHELVGVISVSDFNHLIELENKAHALHFKPWALFNFLCKVLLPEYVKVFGRYAQ